MIRIRRPNDSLIAARLRAPAQLSYAEVGATASFPRSLASKYDIDRYDFPMGKGRDLFERVWESLLSWRHFEVPWVERYGMSSPASTDQLVATLVSVGGFWFLNPCRVIYTELASPEADVAAFAYGTLNGHAECGEERFQVSYTRATGEVSYQIAAFSRPAIFLSRLAYPFARRLQRRFALASADALKKAAA